MADNEGLVFCVNTGVALARCERGDGGGGGLDLVGGGLFCCGVVEVLRCDGTLYSICPRTR